MKHTEMISRRSFLQAAALTAACSALALTGCGSSSSAASSAAGAASAQEGAAVYKVGIVNYVDDASLNQIVASLEARLDEGGPSGASPSTMPTTTPTPRPTSPT